MAPTQVFQHPLEATTGLLLVERRPRYLECLSAAQALQVRSFDLICLHVVVLKDADLSVILWQDEKLREECESRPFREGETFK